MKLLYKISADFIFFIHLFVFLIVLFGWAIPSLWYVYLVTTGITLLVDLFLGYCLLSKWEFSLRKKIDIDLDYDHTWASFYIRKITQNRLSPVFFMWAATFFLGSSLLLNLYFHYIYKY